MATRATYRAKIQNEVDDTSSAAVTIINQAIQEVYSEIAQEIAPFVTGPTSEEIAVTSATVTPTYTYEEIQGVHYKSAGSTNWSELERITEKDYLENHLNDTGTEPQYYLIRDDTIVLNGAPTSGTLRVQGVKVFDELDDELTVSIIPDRYTNVLVLGCIYRFLGYEKDPASENYRAWYEIARNRMLQQLGSRAPIIKPKLY
jgi:hypothetical protein